MTPHAPVLEALLGLPGLVALVVLVVVVFRALTIVDADAKHVVTDDDGAVVEVLDTGVHVRSPLERGTEIVDLRTRTFESTFEDVGTLDGGLVDVDVTIAFRVTDVAAAVEETEDYPLPPWAELSDHDVAILEATEVTLLDAARRRTVEELSTDPGSYADECEAELAPALEPLGIELEDVTVDEITPASEGADGSAGLEDTEDGDDTWGVDTSADGRA